MASRRMLRVIGRTGGSGPRPSAVFGLPGRCRGRPGRPCGPAYVCGALANLCAHPLETGTTVYGLVATREKRHERVRSALGADGRMHLALAPRLQGAHPAALALGLARGPTARAAARLVEQA